jgi:hypothetical protein
MYIMHNMNINQSVFPEPVDRWICCARCAPAGSRVAVDPELV